MFEYFYIIVGETYAAAPYRSEDKELDVDIAEVADKQDRDQQRNQDDDSSHGRCPFLLHLAGETEVADAFTYLLALQPADDAAAGEESNQHAQHDGCHRPEGEVGHQTDSGESCVLQIIE